MQAYIEETASNRRLEAQILPAYKQDLPLKKDGWQFNWRELARKNEEAMFFKLVRTEALQEIEGMLMLTTLLEGKLLQMNNVEVAPDNFGYKKKYDLVAGCLIAYACLMSFKYGQNEYMGFLSFESKTALIGLYQRKYGATVALGQKMFFDDIAGNRLIQKYLGVDLSEIKINHG